jgi:hypothetical protein
MLQPAPVIVAKPKTLAHLVKGNKRSIISSVYSAFLGCFVIGSYHVNFFLCLLLKSHIELYLFFYYIHMSKDNLIAICVLPEIAGIIHGSIGDGCVNPFLAPRDCKSLETISIFVYEIQIH